MSARTSTPVHQSTRTAVIAAPIDTTERLMRVPALRKPVVSKRPFSRLTDGQTHPVTISRKCA